MITKNNSCIIDCIDGFTIGLLNMNDEVYAQEALSGNAMIMTKWDVTSLIDTNGSLWMWDKNEPGQIGDGTTEDRLTTYEIPGIKVDISDGKIEDVLFYFEKLNSKEKKECLEKLKELL